MAFAEFIFALLTDVDNYLFYYPIIMSFRWIIGATIAFFKEEFGARKIEDPPKMDNPPPVTLMIPLYNEEVLCKRTVETALQVDYPNLTVMAVNDCSKDNTAAVLDKLDAQYENLVVIHQKVNQGKAAGLIACVERSDDEILICIDGDTVIDKHAVHWLVRHFDDPKVGAVTGNPRISNRTNVVSRIQVGEYSTMFGMIKRTQNLVGSIYTLSGVIAAYRKTAIREIGYWSHEAMTEDIDVSWKMQRAGWKLKFEAHALVWCLQPESLTGLWKQRKRWAVGGAQVFCKNLDVVVKPSYARLWPLYLEMILSYAWCYLLVIVTFSEILLEPAANLGIGILYKPMILTIVCMFQVFIGTLIDIKYDRTLMHNYRYMIMYPVFFWLIGFCAAAVSFPHIIFNETKKYATWDSSDRGNSAASANSSISGSSDEAPNETTRLLGNGASTISSFTESDNLSSSDEENQSKNSKSNSSISGSSKEISSISGSSNSNNSQPVAIGGAIGGALLGYGSDSSVSESSARFVGSSDVENQFKDSKSTSSITGFSNSYSSKPAAISGEALGYGSDSSVSESSARFVARKFNNDTNYDSDSSISESSARFVKDAGSKVSDKALTVNATSSSAKHESSNGLMKGKEETKTDDAVTSSAKPISSNGLTKGEEETKTDDAVTSSAKLESTNGLAKSEEETKTDDAVTSSAKPISSNGLTKGEEETKTDEPVK